MPKVLVKPHNHTNERANDNDFVGMRFDHENDEPIVRAIFPLGYHFTAIGSDGKWTTDYDSDNNQVKLKQELYDLLCLIKLNSKSTDGLLEGSAESEGNFPFDAYITIIKAFMQYGYYIENEVRYKTAATGKINWKRTIAQIKPTIQKSNAVYTEFVIRQTEKKTDKLISLIHEWCVYEAFKRLGFIYTPFNPRKPQLNISNKEEDNDEREYFTHIIQESLKSTFNDRNKLVFNAMIQMLKYTPSEKQRDFFYGTTNFNIVWEKLIDRAFGIDEQKKKKYYPPARWFPIPKLDSKLKGRELRPDTILETSEEVFILDAKYYRFIEDYRVPAASDINKQITYGKYAFREIVKERQKVYNAFIIPYDFKRDPHGLDIPNDAKYFYIGFATLADDRGNPIDNETYDKVLGILVDTKWLMENAGRINKVELADFIREKHSRFLESDVKRI